MCRKPKRCPAGVPCIARCTMHLPPTSARNGNNGWRSPRPIQSGQRMPQGWWHSPSHVHPATEAGLHLCRQQCKLHLSKVLLASTQPAFLQRTAPGEQIRAGTCSLMPGADTSLLGSPEAVKKFSSHRKVGPSSLEKSRPFHSRGQESWKAVDG